MIRRPVTGTKRDISWVGYKVHLSETCDPETPHVITNVETTPASTPDGIMVAVVHQSLKQRALIIGLQAREHYEAPRTPVNVRQLRSSSRVMLRAPGSRGRMRKQSVAADYGAVVISGWRKPICST